MSRGIPPSSLSLKRLWPRRISCAVPLASYPRRLTADKIRRKISAPARNQIQMALLSPRVPRLPPSAAGALRCCGRGVASAHRCHATAAGGVAAGSPPSSELEAIRWGSAKLQGTRDEMEDEVVLRPGSLHHGFSFAAVFDGHAGFSAVQFLRDELYKECAAALDGGAVLSTKNLEAITASIRRAFAAVDANLSTWLEQMDKDDDSGATATAVFLRNDVLVTSHIGDSCLVISRGGRPEALTNFHRPYGNNKTSLEEVKRIRAAGGWIIDGRICGDISVSRAFGDIRFKTRKNEMLVKGVKEGRWTEKFISRVQFKGDLIISSPDVSLVELGPDVEFVLLATDGLWDYIKSSEAVALVRDQLRQHGDVQLACEALGQKALDQRSQDNISIVIADLGRTNWKELPVETPNLFLELSQAVVTLGAVSVGIWISSFLTLQ
ncbi:probable protein phosphatase 2C 5 isoform X2 [Phragmites australis]|uniref:probable protein phosphatase 2C 5 isoform X2 n=1 Tax=Phragmites australis TaxID=29695 RepID=UPI002D782DB0|nr:probable protein phosphatase 2C 5 isoform X2 [Phragmites australis]